MRKSCLLLTICLLPAAERKVDPTYLYRNVSEVQPAAGYRALFGAGAEASPVVRGVARFGELTVEPGASSKPERYGSEEQAWVILAGTGVMNYGGEKAPVRKNDFFYVTPGMEHSLSCSAGAACRAMIMGFKVPPGSPVRPPRKLDVANIDEVKLQTVGNHPDSVKYRLLMGDTTSTRDRIAAAQVLTSLYVMEFEPGGTNFPHHHETEEEIYLVIGGKGEMVAGGGTNGIEGRHPAKVGDAYFFRLNCTVGFYAATEGAEQARILAVRSRFPFRR